MQSACWQTNGLERKASRGEEDAMPSFNSLFDWLDFRVISPQQIRSPSELERKKKKLFDFVYFAGAYKILCSLVCVEIKRFQTGGQDKGEIKKEGCQMESQNFSGSPMIKTKFFLKFFFFFSWASCDYRELFLGARN